MRGGMGWVCLVMPWAGNECRLSGGLNSYCTIWTTGMTKNLDDKYY